MKLPSRISFALACLLASTAFAASPSAPLRSALDGNAPPYAMPKLDGSIEGLTVDMTREIAKRLGRPVSLESMGFAALIPALQAGTYDMLSVPLVVTKERSETFLMTEGIWSADLIFLISAQARQVTAYEQLKGKTIATNKGNSYEKWAREKASEYGWTVESYGSLNDAAQAVQAGRADAALVGTATGLTISRRNPALKASDLQVATGQFYAYAISRRSPELRQQVDRAIECIKADGTAAKLYQKWLGSAPAKGSLEVTSQPGSGNPGMPNYDVTPQVSACQ